MSRLSPAVLALSLMAAVAALPADAGVRAFVASSGSDTGICSPTTPCRTIAYAHSVVDVGGEIIALDAAGYGIVTITKSVTIMANPGVYAGMGNSTGSVITIATAGVNVTLRGLNIRSSGATNGVLMTNGATLSIENCIISNFTGGAGVNVTTAATVRIIDSIINDNYFGVFLQGGATADISGSKLVGNGQAGVWVDGGTAATTTTAAISDTIATGNWVGFYAANSVATASARMSVTRSTSANNGYGVVAENSDAGTTVVTISNNMVTGNSLSGLYQDGTATLESLGNNTVRQNGANTGAITTVLSM